MGKLPFYIQDQRKVCLSTYNLIKSRRETIHQESISTLTSRRLKNQSFAQLTCLDIMSLSSSCLFMDFCLSILTVQHICTVCLL